MTDEEYHHHRTHAKPVWQISGHGSYGLCSRLPSGQVKVEGYAPMNISELTEGQRSKLQEAGVLP